MRIAELTADLSVTQQRLQTVEEELRKTLEREKELHDALEREKRLNEFKSGFIAVISNEVRTPLTSIYSSAEILERYGHIFTEEKKRRYYLRIQRAVNHMTQLLDNMLFLGKAEMGKRKFNPAPLDLEQFCLSLVKELKLGGSTQDALTFINYTPDCKADMDKLLLSYILRNVLFSAICYSGRDGKVLFNLECVNGTVRFCIQNKRVWPSFNQTTDIDTLFYPAYGWDVVKKCVDLHKGQITVESVVDVGTTFTVTLPLKEESA